MELIPQAVHKVIGTLQANGEQAYVVGGAVRDLELGRTPNDWDVATSATGEKVAGLFPHINPVGIRHDTVGVLEDGVWIEVTRFRDPERSLHGDLALRDFTVNAMALDLSTGRVIDPLGGTKDAAEKSLRACGNAADRFREDPLRILRAARFFSSMALRPDGDVTKAASESPASVSGCAVERIREEWMKLLLGESIREAFHWMRDTGLLAVIFPAVAAADGVGQNRFHRWDVFQHTVETIARAVPQPDVRLAAMFHDLGKPATKRWRKGDWTFYNHERVSAEIAEAELARYRFSHNQARRVVSLVGNHMFHYEPEWTDAAVRRFIRRISPELLDAQFFLRLADSSAAGMGGEQETKANLHTLRLRIETELRRSAAMRITDLAITGHDVARATGGSGPLVGRILRRLLEDVTDTPELNERARLQARTEELLREFQESSS